MRVKATSFPWRRERYYDDMRIFLISANTESFPEPVFPIGTVYTGNALQAQGAEVLIFDMRHSLSGASLEKQLAAFSPDRIGISLRNLDNAAYPATLFYLPSHRSLIERVRASSSAPIILGGSAFSLFPEEMLSALGADAGVAGEGELAGGVFRDSVRGTVQKTGHSGCEHTMFPENIRKLFPDFPRYRTVGIQTARGCPNGCVYCTYPGLEGSSVRARDPEAVVSEMAKLHRDEGTREFFIVDALFNSDEGHMVKVIEKLASQHLPVRFACYLQPRVSDPGIFRLLKEAGCIAVDFGTDSGSEAMLRSLGKPFNRNDIRIASQACRDAGLDFCHSLLLGGPGETPGTIRETVSLMDETGARAVVAMTGIRIYPGTGIEKASREEGIIGEEESLLEPRFYFPSMGPSSLLRHAYEAGEGRRNWFFPGKRVWSRAVGFRILRFLHRRGPLWRMLRK
jgi:radical SAM superfamily enzyme YgiQ (UPF0313 family)